MLISLLSCLLLLQYRVDDIEWVLAEHRPLLRRFGYDHLYEAWIAATRGVYNTTTLQDHVRAIMHNTAEAANWGEAL